MKGYAGIMEMNMETTIVCWGSIGIMEKKIETTIKRICQRNPDSLLEGMCPDRFSST